MCNEIHIDSLFVMWTIGGAFLGWVGVKSYKRWRSGKDRVESQETNESIDSIGE